MSAVEAARAIEIFFEGFNAEDDERIREGLNFPHVRVGKRRPLFSTTGK